MTATKFLTAKQKDTAFVKSVMQLNLEAITDAKTDAQRETATLFAMLNIYGVGCPVKPSDIQLIKMSRAIAGTHRAPQLMAEIDRLQMNYPTPNEEN